jgi:hypothetical protein
MMGYTRVTSSSIAGLLLKAGSNRRGFSRNKLVKERHVVRRVIRLVRSQALMLPLRKTIWLRDVKLLLVATVGIVRVAARDERIAIRMDLVCGVADLDGGTGYPPLAKRGAKGRLNFPVIGLLNALKVR